MPLAMANIRQFTNCGLFVKISKGELDMTDNDIIKALECCTTNGASCKGCPAFVKVDRSNCKKYFCGALDLITRQKARIKELEERLNEK